MTAAGCFRGHLQGHGVEAAVIALAVAAHQRLDLIGRSHPTPPPKPDKPTPTQELLVRVCLNQLLARIV
ncbi:hypothetical protein Ate02nite_61400 [Paractinoplanes tereljensis]|uniref:Uncharacterized protein n=1 Tax=Paractinoplanes tereljensis TaxID=571912 RepID=A0A919NQW6_9ACTN|nr:hypothetical protein Ate02nite_61400 [Actinoplanes tereljensis]